MSIRRRRRLNERDLLVDPEAYHDTCTDGELLQGDQRASHFRGSALGVVHWDNHRETSDSHTSDEATGEDGVRTDASDKSGREPELQR
jgi:hypothetical protein